MQKKIQVFIFMLLITLLTSCHVARYFYWNVADVNDHKKFPKIEIEAPEKASEYVGARENFDFQVPEKYENKSNLSFGDFISQHNTLAFLVVRNDSMIYENYFEGYTKQTVIPSFSVAKSVVSALVGIAISEGKIESTDQVVTDFLDGFKHGGFDKITIENLLNMRSGIEFREDYLNPFGHIARFYYGRDIERYVKNLKVVKEPGTEYEYVSANTLLASLILKKATGMNVAEYLEEKIWKPAGMQYPATWSIDSKKHRTIKSFCCLNARPIDFARFGSIYLHKGFWNGKQIIPASWIERSTSIMNDSRDSQDYPYTYFWRVLKNGSIFAKGILGQYIIVIPEKHIVIVRMGNGFGGIDWMEFSLELAKQL